MTASPKLDAAEVIIERLRHELWAATDEIIDMKHKAETQRVHHSRLLTAVAAGCFGLGAIGAIIITPMPKLSKDCEVFKVANKPVTAFVLKPPPNNATPAPIEHQICPPVPTCPEPKAEETVDTKGAEEEHKPSRHRRHRVRRYWR